MVVSPLLYLSTTGVAIGMDCLSFVICALDLDSRRVFTYPI